MLAELAEPTKLLTRTTIPLNQAWTFKQSTDRDETYLAVSQFPTNIHLDLLHHGLIPDPFVAQNETSVQWVGETAWTYRTAFLAPAAAAAARGARSVLAFDGLDTFATVTLNGTKILTTTNMFIPERVDVTGLLKPSEKEGAGKPQNVLEIRFESAWLRGKELVEMQPQHGWGCWNGDPSRLAVRKAQYHYGWDWGPKLMTCGPWRQVSLEAYGARIAGLWSRARIEREGIWGKDEPLGAEMDVFAEVEGQGLAVRFEVGFDGQVVVSGTVDVAGTLARTTLKVERARLWWPAGHGEQPLYTLRAVLLSGDEEVDVSCKRFGLRQAEVVQAPIANASGTTFMLRINGRDVFCGGSCWIPADSFLPRLVPQRYRDWVRLLVDGNQNMVRVWGGGIYEDQAFYDACDEMGVLVWQDFLFACGNYPTDPAFLESVAREAEENVKLLRHHPSIVIWAGNNEDYQYQETEGLEYDRRDKDPESWLKGSFPARYIYEKLLADVTKELIPDTYYHPGSPLGGKFKGTDTRDRTMGDIHQWNVWHGTQEPYQNWADLSGRFVSEFGMQSLPRIRTIDSFLARGAHDADRYAQSATLDHHNKAAGHSRRLAAYMAENLRFRYEPIEAYVYATQLMQAECLAAAYRLWRREWTAGARSVAGALVWQANDCWPCTSWAIADYHSRPKAAYYAIKRELAPLAVGMRRVAGARAPEGPAGSSSSSSGTTTVEVWLSNLAPSAREVSARLRAFDVETGKRLWWTGEPTAQLMLQPNTAREHAVLDLARLTPAAAAAIVVVADLLDPADGRPLARCVNWPEPLKFLHLQTPKNLRLESRPEEEGEGEEETGEGEREEKTGKRKRTILSVSADVLVKGLVLEGCGEAEEDVEWEDNCVDLVPDEVVEVGVRGWREGMALRARCLNSLGEELGCRMNQGFRELFI